MFYAICSGLAGAVWGSSEVAVKWINPSNILPLSIVLMTYRASFQIAIVSVVAILKEGTLKPADGEGIYVMIRGISEAIASSSLYMAINYIMPAECCLIISTKTFFILITARIFLGERHGLFRVSLIICSFIGAILVSNPVQMYTDGMFSTSSMHRIFGILLILLSITTSTIYIVSCRKLTKTPVAITIFWISFWCLLINSSAALTFVNHERFYNIPLLVTSAAIAVCVLLGEALITYSLMSEDAATVNIYINMAMPFSLVGQQILFKYIAPPIIQIGSALILITIILNSQHDRIVAFFRRENSPVKRKLLGALKLYPILSYLN